MNKNGPIIVIEDDPDDQMMLTEVFKILKIENEIRINLGRKRWKIECLTIKSHHILENFFVNM